MSPIFKMPKPIYSPTRDYMRVAAMLTMLVIILGMLLALQTQVKQPAPQEGDAPPPGGDAGEPPPRRGPPTQPIAVADGKEEELLAQVRDDAPLANDRQIYYHMLAKIFNMSQAEIAGKVDHTLVPFDCLSEPGKCRGKFIRFSGSLWRLHEVKMNPESGFDRVYEGTIACQGPAGGPYVFCTVVLTQKPDPKIQPQKREVVLSGVFLKRIVYENQGEPDEHGVRNLTMSPMFIGRRLDLAKPQPPVGRGETVLFFSISILALGLFAYLVLFKRTKSAHERHFALPSEEDDLESDSTVGGEEAEETERDAASEQPPDADEKLDG